MNKKLILSAVMIAFCLHLGALASRAQSDDVPKIEVAAEFTSLTQPSSDGGATEPGFGGRFTYNLNRSVAVEAVGYFFPHQCQSRFCGSGNNGNISEGLFGVKAGKRFQKWGIFAKGRPGLISFSQGNSGYVQIGPQPGDITFVRNRGTHFALDAGGVVEFYPSRRIVTRFDAGDTLIHYGARTENFLIFTGVSGIPTIFPFHQPARTRHNFQFAASVGFRF